MNAQPPARPHRRAPEPGAGPVYGCAEFRDDLEAVIGSRCTEEVRRRFHEHRLLCRDCERVHQVLSATYVGPEAPPEPSPEALDAAFARLAPRIEAERRRSRPSRKFAVGASFAGLSAAAAVLLAMLVGPTSAPEPLALGIDEELLADVEVPAHARAGERVHRAIGFGRVVAGEGELFAENGERIKSDNFAPGTRFAVAGPAPLQVGLAGRILANILPDSHGTWSAFTSELIELRLDRGMIAVRYERREGDPVLQVRTPTSIVRVIGTVFTVAVDDAGQTTVAVLRGKVEVVHAETGRVVAEVTAGNSFDVATSTYANVSNAEVVAALPLSSEALGAGGSIDGEVPTSWTVPGLPADGPRTLAALVDDPVATVHEELPERRKRTNRRASETDDVLAALVEEAKASRKRELRESLEVCRELYTSADTRFRAARCLTRFMREYGDEAEAVEGLLLIAILKMDFAQDYPSADFYLHRFLREAPNHPKADLAAYKLMISAVESGRVVEGRRRGLAYLEHYPSGRHREKILDRFPELRD